MRLISSFVLLLSLSAWAAEPEHDPGDGGKATDAFLNFPESVALDSAGNIYVAERGGNRVRRIDSRTNIITTIAGAGEVKLKQPTGLLVDKAGAVIIGDTFNHRILRLDQTTGSITTIAGTGEFGWEGDGGPAARAKITAPFGLALDSDENLYFTDTEVHRIRRIDRRTGVITTVAGNGIWAFGGDGGPATSASLARPHRVVFDPHGDLLIADSFNQRIRRVDMKTGIIQTIAGSGLRGSSGDGGPAKDATFCYFGDLIFDRRGDLIVSGVCDNRVRRIDMKTGTITPFAGNGEIEFAGDGKPFLQSSFGTPVGMALGRDGIYMADMRSHRIVRFDSRSGTVVTVAGGKVPRSPVIPWRFVYKREQMVKDQSAPVAYSVPGMDAATVRQDLRYAGDPLRRLDLYRPPTRGPLPLIILVSGRNDTEVVPDEWGVSISRARLFAASGFAVAMYNHRLGLNGSLVQGAEDLQLLLRYLSANAGDLDIDPSRIVIVTYSMGSTALPELMRKPHAGVKAIVAMYPWADLRELQSWQAPGKTSENAAQYSMVTSLVEGVPMLVIRAGKDAELIRKGIDALIAEAMRRNIEIEVINHPQGETNFDVKPDDKRVPVIMRRVIEFARSSV